METYPKVSASFLAKLGALEREGERFLGFESHGLEVLVRTSEISLVDLCHRDSEGRTLCQTVDLQYQLIGATCKPFLLCPLSGENCAEILLVNRLWASRRGHGLRVRNGTPEQIKRKKLLDTRRDLLAAFSAPGVHARTKDKLIEQLYSRLGANPILPDPLIELEEIIEQAAWDRQTKQRNASRSRHPQELTIAAAIKCGQSAAGSVELGMYLTRPRRNSVAPLIDQLMTSRRDIAVQENHLRLDLSALQSAGLLKPGCRTHWILDLHGMVPPPADRALLAVDLRGGSSSLHLLFMDPHATVAQSQTIGLAIRQNIPGRYFLRCPARGTFHGSLFFRDGFFASSIAQRLKTRSQLGPDYAE